ncbi:hypothetical protein D9M68_707480 [compost metagenome]
MRKSLETLLADVFLVGLEVHQDLGRVARDAQAGADHQKREDQQKPPGAVDREQPGTAKHIGPERAELVDVVVQGFVLLDHGPDDRRDADHRQQRNRKPHGRQQLNQLAGEARPGADLQALGRYGHLGVVKNKKGGSGTTQNAP